MKKPSLLLALLILSSPSHGGAYKCKDALGKIIFSDTACSGTEAEPVRIEKTVQPPTQEEALQKCYQLHSSHPVGYKDRESLRMEGGHVEWVAVRGIGAVRMLTVLINAKNSYGAYAGPKPNNCLWMADGRIIDSHGFDVIP